MYKLGQSVGAEKRTVAVNMWYSFLLAVSFLVFSSGGKYDVNIKFCTCYIVTGGGPIPQPVYGIMFNILD